MNDLAGFGDIDFSSISNFYSICELICQHVSFFFILHFTACIAHLCVCVITYFSFQFVLKWLCVYFQGVNDNRILNILKVFGVTVGACDLRSLAYEIYHVITRLPKPPSRVKQWSFLFHGYTKAYTCYLIQMNVKFIFHSNLIYIPFAFSVLQKNIYHFNTLPQITTYRTNVVKQKQAIRAFNDDHVQSYTSLVHQLRWHAYSIYNTFSLA